MPFGLPRESRGFPRRVEEAAVGVAASRQMKAGRRIAALWDVAPSLLAYREA